MADNLRLIINSFSYVVEHRVILYDSDQVKFLEHVWNESPVSVLDNGQR